MWINVYDPFGYAIGIGVVLASTIAAAFVPARRAATVNPVEALRAEFLTLWGRRAATQLQQLTAEGRRGLGA